MTTVKLTVHPVPLPVRGTVGTAVRLLNEYPTPPLIRSPAPTIDPPWPSITPVTLTSSLSDAAPVLTFLPIGRLATVLVPEPSIATLNFRGNERIGLCTSNCVLKLPGSIGLL